MKRARVLIIVSLAAAAAAAIWLGQRTSRPFDDAPIVVLATPPIAPAPADSAVPRSDSPTEVLPRLPPDPMAVSFEATDDLLAFIEGLHEAATLGDGAAAYYLYRALYRCQQEYQTYFGPNRHERALDDVLAEPDIVRMYGETEIRRMHGQCQRLREADLARFGERDSWLPKAAEAGFPRAEAEWAFRLAFGRDRPADGEALEKARELARAAVSSRDPAVFVPVSSVIGVLTGESDNMIRDASWLVAACQRGFDCGPRSEMTRIICRFDSNCQPYESSLDLLRRGAADDFDAIERGAREINEAIDAGRLEELGL